MVIRNLARLALVTMALGFFDGPGRRADAQEPAPSPPKPSPQPGPIELVVTPRPADSPAFHHRLLPVDADRTPGDAAPIYLRLHGEFTEGMRLLLEPNVADWLKLPPDQFPSSEARAFVDRYSSKFKQIGFGARRRSCDWNYTLPEEKEHAFEVLLPDVQEMKQWGRLLALKARVEIAEGKLDEAIVTLETGLSFSRHVAEGPFAINALVGIVSATAHLDRVDDLVAQPESPNLYWPLTALPRPLVGVRKSLESEAGVIHGIFPELVEADRPRTEAEWSPLLARFHGRLVAAWTNPNYFDPATKTHYHFEADLAKFRSTVVPEARAYLSARGVEVAGMTDDRALMTYASRWVREHRDEWSKPFYLPFPEAIKVRAAGLQRFLEKKSEPLGMLVALTPSVDAARTAEAGLDRKVAALRVVEAIRMQAAKDGNRLPRSLAEVTVVPVPLDPTTGKAFEYRLDGDTANLASPTLSGIPLAYKITLRK